MRQLELCGREWVWVVDTSPPLGMRTRPPITEVTFGRHMLLSRDWNVTGRRWAFVPREWVVFATEEEAQAYIDRHQSLATVPSRTAGGRGKQVSLRQTAPRPVDASALAVYLLTNAAVGEQR